MTDDELYLAWSRSVASLVSDALMRAALLPLDDVTRATDIAAKEIYVRLAAGDRPDRTNWRFNRH